jgi:hypothetical protein
MERATYGKNGALPLVEIGACKAFFSGEFAALPVVKTVAFDRF